MLPKLLRPRGAMSRTAEASRTGKAAHACLDSTYAKLVIPKFHERQDETTETGGRWTDWPRMMRAMPTKTPRRVYLPVSHRHRSTRDGSRPMKRISLLAL